MLLLLLSFAREAPPCFSHDTVDPFFLSTFTWEANGDTKL